MELMMPPHGSAMVKAERFQMKYEFASCSHNSESWGLTCYKHLSRSAIEESYYESGLEIM